MLRCIRPVVEAVVVSVKNFPVNFDEIKSAEPSMIFDAFLYSSELFLFIHISLQRTLDGPCSFPVFCLISWKTSCSLNSWTSANALWSLYKIAGWSSSPYSSNRTRFCICPVIPIASIFLLLPNSERISHTSSHHFSASCSSKPDKELIVWFALEDSFSISPWEFVKAPFNSVVPISRTTHKSGRFILFFLIKFYFLLKN